MSLQDLLRQARGDRTEGLLEAGVRAERRQPRVPDEHGLARLAADLGMPYHDESLRIEAAEQQWREGFNL